MARSVSYGPVVTPFLPDPDKLAAVRTALPALAAGIYLNTAVAGPLPVESAAAMAELAERELRMGRGHPADVDDARHRADEAHAAVASVLRVDPRSIALTHGPAQAMALATTLLGSAPSERASAPNTLVVEDDDGADDDAIVARAGNAIVAGTRLVSVSHVDPATGAVLPVRRIAEVAHERGAAVLVDGSQAVGAMPVDPDALGADAYALAGETWLLGPDGIGALWVRPAILERAGLAEAASLEVGLPTRTSVLGLARGIGWLAMFVGWDYVHRRGPLLARSMADRLASIPNVSMLTPRDRMATLVTFRIDGWPAERALDELADRAFVIADVVPARDAVRLGVGFFSTTEELERLAATVELLAAHTPDDLPRRPRLAILGTDLA